MKRLFISLAIFLSLLTSALTLFPQSASAAVEKACNNSSFLLGIPPWYQYLDVGYQENKDTKGNVVSTDACAIKGPLNSDGSFDFKAAISRVALAVVDILLRIGALVSIGFIIYGGFRYILSQGEPDHTKKARGTILNAIIGLVITMLSTVIVTFVGNTLWK